MDVVSRGPLRVASLVWQSRPRAFVLTVVCRATFQLVPGESLLAHDQEPPSEEDNFWNDDPTRSLHTPSDLVPFKQRAEVLLVGNAFAPAMTPVRSLLARLIVGEIDKSIEVFGERSFTPDGQLREGARFIKMPLRWERAAGGPGTANPVGVRMDVADTYGATPVPNLQPPGQFLSRRGEIIAPVGFGPIAPSWSGRRKKLGQHVGTWPPGGSRGWVDHAFPADIDQAYFNAAPLDQQLAELRDNERIVLENLHPEHPKLVTSLPGLRPLATVERPGGASEELAMRADTLWIDTDRAICTLTWRGQRRLVNPEEPGRVVVSLERGTRSWSEPEGEQMQTLVPEVRAAPILPFFDAPPEASPMARPSENEEISVDDEGHEGSSGEAIVHTIFLAPDMNPGGPAPLPFPSARRLPVPPAPPPPPVPPALLPVPPAPPRASPAPLPAAPLPVLRAAVPVGSPMGAADLSNAAAGLSPPPLVTPPRQETLSRPQPSEREPSRESVRLVWFDFSVMERVRNHPKWRKIVRQLSFRPGLPPPPDNGEDGNGLPPATDERALLEVLARGECADAEGLNEAFLDAVGDGGPFVPPLVLTGGKLELAFDGIETLKATIAVVTALIGADAGLKAAVDAAHEVLKTPWLDEGSDAVERATVQIRKAFASAQARRAVPAGPFEAQATRILLRQRQYRRRVVFGQTCIQGHLMATGTGSAIPTYLPEAAWRQMPMSQSIEVRVIAELDVQQEEGETHPNALRMFAVAQLFAPPGFAPNMQR